MSKQVCATFLEAGEYKPPGWTGTYQGVGETFARTPACAQLTAKIPLEGEFLHTVKLLPEANQKRDPCNGNRTKDRNNNNGSMWPSLQSQGHQEAAKPISSNIQLGDSRIKPYLTSYAQGFAPPLPEGAVIRSPLRNEALATSANLKEEYKFAMQRIGEKRLKDIISHMRERIHGRIGNKSDNAFRLRKFAKMYDTNHTGLINLEDFRVMTETSGMQLDDDSLLSLFSKYDNTAEGQVRYADIMKDLLDDDAFALFMGGTEGRVPHYYSQTLLRVS